MDAKLQGLTPDLPLLRRALNGGSTAELYGRLLHWTLDDLGQLRSEVSVFYTQTLAGIEQAASEVVFAPNRGTPESQAQAVEVIRREAAADLAQTVTFLEAVVDAGIGKVGER